MWDLGTQDAARARLHASYCFQISEHESAGWEDAGGLEGKPACKRGRSLMN